MTKTKPIICFVDDDENELARFTYAMHGRFDVITGTGFAVCRKQLDERKLLRPDLWVLDLYFPEQEGASNTPDELATMNGKFLELNEAIDQFRAFLQSIGQGVGGGLTLIEKCKAAGGPVLMLTRKGMLDDAILCIDHGATAVLKKPMPATQPDDDSPEAIRRVLDEAMIENSQQLIDHFERAIRESSWWTKNRGTWMFCLGIAAGALFAWCLQYVVSLTY